MHRLLVAVVCLSGLATTAACAKMRRPDDDAQKLSRQAAEPEGEAAPPARRAGETGAAPRAERSRQQEEAEEEPSEPSAEENGTGAGARERKMDALVESGAVVDSSELGYFMDVHEASLRGATNGTDVSLGRNGNRFRLGVPESACFAEGSDELTGSIRSTLGSLAGVLAEFDKTLVTVVVHAADRELSRRRARAVARFLEDRGVAEGRLVAIGRADADSGEAGRVEIVVEPVVE